MEKTDIICLKKKDKDYKNTKKIIARLKSLNKIVFNYDLMVYPFIQLYIFKPIMFISFRQTDGDKIIF